MTADSQPRWWDVATGAPIGEPIIVSAEALATSKATNYVDYLAVNLDMTARLFTVVGAEGPRQWNFDFATWPVIACARAGRNLTRADWRAGMPTGEPYHVTCPQYPAD